MTHKIDGKGQTLSFNVSGLGADAERFLTYLLSNIPSGSGMMKLDALGKVSWKIDDQNIIAITVTDPPEHHKSFVMGDTNLIYPTSKPGWLMSLFRERSCKFSS